jgi:hypothetical protein
MAIHVEWELLIDELPTDCIYDCSEPGCDAEPAVEFWIAELGFTVNRAKAEPCLRGYGAWSAEELAEMEDEEIAKKVLWLACNDFREYINDTAAAGYESLDDVPDDFDAACGSDIFVLE